MRTFTIFISCIVLMCCSCANKYHVFQVASSQVETKLDGTFISTHEKLQIKYDFWALGGAIWIEVTNVSESELCVLIGESALKVNERPIPHMDKGEIAAARLDPSFMPQAIVCLAPNTSYGFESLPIQMKKWKFPSQTAQLNFEQKTTPLRIQHQLLMAQDPIYSTPDTLRDKFWISSISKMKGVAFKEQEIELAEGSHFFLFRDDTQLWLDIILSILEISASFI